MSKRKGHNLRNKILFYAACILLSPFCILPAVAQIENALTGTATRVTCAATGSSTQAAALNFRRRSITLQNKAGKQIRIGMIPTGTPLLTGSNSWVQEASSNYLDSAPGVYTGRFVCMSIDATTADIDVTETSR